LETFVGQLCQKSSSVQKANDQKLHSGLHIKIQRSLGNPRRADTDHPPVTLPHYPQNPLTLSILSLQRLLFNTEITL